VVAHWFGDGGDPPRTVPAGGYGEAGGLTACSDTSTGRTGSDCGCSARLGVTPDARAATQKERWIWKAPLSEVPLSLTL